MPVVRLTGEGRAKELDATDGPCAGDPARSRALARSFKTFTAGSAFPVTHRRQRTTTDQILAFLLFAVVAAVTPGPSNVMLTAAGANAGVLRGLPCLFGVSTGMGAMMFAVPLGLGSLVLRRPLVLTALNVAGGAFLLWLAWKIATARGVDARPDARPVGFVAAAAFQWINPKSWLVSASAAGTFLGADAGSPLAQAGALGALFVVAALPSGLLWLAFGATVQRVLRDERRLRIFNVLMGLLLGLSVAVIVL